MKLRVPATDEPNAPQSLTQGLEPDATALSRRRLPRGRDADADAPAPDVEAISAPATSKASSEVREDPVRRKRASKEGRSSPP